MPWKKEGCLQPREGVLEISYGGGLTKTRLFWVGLEVAFQAPVRHESPTLHRFSLKKKISSSFSEFIFHSSKMPLQCGDSHNSCATIGLFSPDTG